MNDNLRVNRVFNFVDSEKAVTIATDYVKEGCFYTFMNIPSVTENFGFVSKDGKTNRFTVPSASEPLVLGEELKKDGQSVSSFRDVYYDPSFIGEHADEYLGSNVFVPKDAATTTYGTFILRKEVEIDEEQTQDNTVILENFSKAMGVYETIQAFDDPSTPEADIVLNRAELYFSQKGKTFTATFYHTFKGGFDSLRVTCTISNIGNTKVNAISNYLAA